MKAGTRALGVAESYVGQTRSVAETWTTDADGRRTSATAPPRSTLAGAVVRGDRVVDGFGFGDCTVGGRDATEAIGDLFFAVDREDVRYVFVAGIALSWFNVVDLHRLAERLQRPVLSISFEASSGLESALGEHFSGADLSARLGTYRAQPPRRTVEIGEETVYVRAVGIDDERAASVVQAFTPEGGRPEPLRVARLAARAARGWMETSESTRKVDD
ncbi:MAG: DUF99 family protein [Halobacteriota archaeon]